MLDQLIIGEKASLDDFDASIAGRDIGEPTKKEIKDTVPFFNGTYDFSKINGELYWNERELEYAFEIIADTPEELERKKTAFKNWVMNVMEEKLYDPYITDYHFWATFKDIDPADDESLNKTTITVKFTAYPYQIANDPTEYEFVIPAGTEKTVNIINGGIHGVTPTVVIGAAITLTVADTIYTAPAGEITDSRFELVAGGNTWKIKNENDAECTVTVKFFEEVF